jgi:hypothetical protein
MDSPFTSARLSRRAWTLLFTSIPLLAQAPPVADTPEQKMQKAIADVRSISERLAQTDVPIDVEPAFTFRA